MVHISLFLLPIVTPVFLLVANREAPKPMWTGEVVAQKAGQHGHGDDLVFEPYWFFDFGDTPLARADFDRCRLTGRGGTSLEGRCSRGAEGQGRSTMYFISGTAQAPQLKWTVTDYKEKTVLEMEGTLSNTADTIQGTWRTPDRRAHGTFIARRDAQYRPQ